MPPAKGPMSHACAHCLSGRLPFGGEVQELKFTLQEDIPDVSRDPLSGWHGGGNFTSLIYFIFLPPKWQAYILLYLLSIKFLLQQIWILHV